MAFTIYYNQYTNASKQPTATKTMKIKNKKAWQRALNIPVPQYIPFIRDVNLQINTFQNAYGLSPSSISNGPYTITMNNAISKTNKLKKCFKNKAVLQLSGEIVTSHLILNQKPKQLTITETSESRINITRNNIKTKYNNIDFVIGDWLHLDNKALKTKLFDIIICIPPFITINHSNRRYYIDELILNSWRYLNNNGYLIFVQSSMALTEQTVYKLKQNGYSHINIVYGAKYYWRDSYLNDKAFVNEVDSNLKRGYNVYEIDTQNNKRIETLYVIMAQLKKH